MKPGIQGIFDDDKHLLYMVDKIIYYFRMQNFDRALRLSKQFLNRLTTLIEKLVVVMDYFNKDNEWVRMESIQSMLLTLLKTQEDRDWILLADLYETQVLSFLLSLQEIIIFTEEFEFSEEGMNENISRIRDVDTNLAEVLEHSMKPMELLDHGYLVEYTAGGDFTVGIEQNGMKRYFHSNNRVRQEALMLASSWYREDKNGYIVYGLGFGYHIMGLFERDENITVEAYESDIHIIKLACAFSDMKELLQKPNFHLIYDPRFVRLKNRLRDGMDKTEFVIHYPSLANIKKADIKERLEDYFLQYSSLKDQLSRMNGNFIENVKHNHPTVDDLVESFQDKDLYIIAAGPSLDKNYKELKKVSDQGVLLATGTVFHKLMAAGIKPDYVIVTDSAARVYRQVAGLEESGVPLIYLSTAYQGFARDYKANRYIVFQKEYDLAEEEAERRGCSLYNTGGSVSTLALDIGIRLHSRRIIFLGLDLSYPNHLIHASGTSLRELKDTTGLRQVKDISGELVYTNKAMDLYRKWMEKRIAKLEKPEIIDATEGGAFIKGMKNERLRDVIQ